ncbi:hypothetical protein IWW36_001752 [Coemansia brasiliensis]|uniref:Fungal-type protein kinase domain-containing protein n=1 Tax=Coemansia brasiliensis TaxID=2650707 RepID=A0A9W8IDB9_9FUNG|nr:hypothetical protein IWW36_001752 [Coemansia brasiliensis]
MQQLDRRFLWGLTVCASSIYAVLMVHDRVFASPAMDIRTPEGRKKFISLLVYWSMCPKDRLGYDPTIRRCELNSLQVAADGNVAEKADSTVYEVDCYDDKECQWRTYITVRTIAAASRFFGRHTRTVIARRKHGASDSAISKPASADIDAQGVVIKDSWAVADAEEDAARNEVELLRIVRDTFAWDKSMVYPKLEAGGTVRLDRDGTYVDDTTATMLDIIDTDTQKGFKAPYRVHRHIVTTPVGSHIKPADNEAEIVIDLVETMYCHNRILNECGILHRDIFTNNILAVRSNSN